MCGIQPLVQMFPSLVQLSKTTHTSWIFNSVVKRTFFKHFCGGENLKEVLPTMEKLAKSQIGSILDLAVEADLDAADLTGVDAQKNAASMVIQLKECIDIASHQPESFIAVKITALVPPTLLSSWSNTLKSLNTAFNEVKNPDNNSVDLAGFQKLQNYFPGLSDLDMPEVFAKNDLNKSGSLSWSDITSIFSLFSIDNCRALVRTNDLKSVTNCELDTGKLVIDEIRVLCEYAQASKVKILMDAEQTWFQPAIDDIVIGLCRSYNAKLTSNSAWKSPLIYNTYQMYLTSSLERLKADVIRARQKGYAFGIKIVRGAYMVSERRLAEIQGVKSPIHATVEDTHDAFNAGVQFINEQQCTFPKNEGSVVGLSVLVASHNHESLAKTCQFMEKYEIPKSGGWVSFGQLLGMQDGTTQSLASEGFQALKYVPYGPVEVAIPYLHRRAQENQAMIKAMDLDKASILEEIKMRFSRIKK